MVVRYKIIQTFKNTQQRVGAEVDSANRLCRPLNLLLTDISLKNQTRF